MVPAAFASATPRACMALFGTCVSVIVYWCTHCTITVISMYFIKLYCVAAEQRSMPYYATPISVYTCMVLYVVHITVAHAATHVLGIIIIIIRTSHSIGLPLGSVVWLCVADGLLQCYTPVAFTHHFISGMFRPDVGLCSFSSQSVQRRSLIRIPIQPKHIQCTVYKFNDMADETRFGVVSADDGVRHLMDISHQRWILLCHAKRLYSIRDIQFNQSVFFIYCRIPVDRYLKLQFEADTIEWSVPVVCNCVRVDD